MKLHGQMTQQQEKNLLALEKRIFLLLQEGEFTVEEVFNLTKWRNYSSVDRLVRKQKEHEKDGYTFKKSKNEFGVNKYGLLPPENRQMRLL